MRFDHLQHWVPDLDRAVAQYQDLGFNPVYGGQHPGMGTHNYLCHIGLAYIELLGIHDRDQARSARTDRFAPIEVAISAGGGTTQFAVDVTDVAAAVAQVRAAGLQTTEPRRGSRRLPDESIVSFAPAQILEGPQWRPFFIQWDLASDQRKADLQQRGFITAPQDGWAIDHLVVETTDPEESARWLSRALGLPVVSSGPGEYTVPLARGQVKLVSGPAERITQVVLRGPGVRAGEVAGLRFGAVASE